MSEQVMGQESVEELATYGPDRPHGGDPVTMSLATTEEETGVISGLIPEMPDDLKGLENLVSVETYRTLRLAGPEMPPTPENIRSVALGVIFGLQQRLNQRRALARVGEREAGSSLSS